MTRSVHHLAAAVAASVLACAGCGSGHRAGDRVFPQTVPDRVRVGSVEVAGLGRVLADADGHVLYMFPPDARSRVSCTGPCAGTWPPLVIAEDHRPTAANGVVAGDLSTLPDPNTGARIVTYAGYPLYRYAGDVAAGTADGQALFLDGGPWYAVNPQGQPVTTTAKGEQ